MITLNINGKSHQLDIPEDKGSSDEMKRFSQLFEAMINDLQRVTVSYDELAREVEERTLFSSQRWQTRIIAAMLSLTR